MNLQRSSGNQAVGQLLGSRNSESSSNGKNVLGNYLPLSGPFAAFSGTHVRPVAGLAGNQKAAAQARNGAIEIDAEIMKAPGSEMQSLLAHETIHLAQQQGKGRSASTGVLETEASQLSSRMLAGQPVWPLLSGSSSVPLKQPPGKTKDPTEQELRELDEAYKAAKSGPNLRLDHLKAELAYLRQLQTLLKERQGLESSRLRLDSANAGNLFQFGFEAMSIDHNNWGPLNIHVMPPHEGDPGELEFGMHFQARFLGRKMPEAQADFETLRKSLEAGVKKIWGQTLGNMPSLVRNYDFIVSPTISLIDNGVARDPNAFLIEVDPQITRAQTVGGTVSIAPGDISKADTLGHETLHLMGLIDRYRDNLQTKHSESIRGATVGGQGTGATRNDPLDTGKGPILAEDLEFVFAHSGTYDKVIMANLDPYNVALLKRFGRADIPDIPDLLTKADDESARVLQANTNPATGKAGQRTLVDQADPQKIVLRMIMTQITQLNAKIDTENMRSQMSHLPDMAPPPVKHVP